MELLDYLKSLNAPEQEQFAVRVGTTIKHLRNVAYKQRRASAALAAQIAIETDGAVPLSSTRGKDWKLIWDRRLNRLIEASAVADHTDAQPNGAEGRLQGMGQAAEHQPAPRADETLMAPT